MLKRLVGMLILMCAFMSTANALYDSSSMRPFSTTPNISMFDANILQLAAGASSSYVPTCPTGQTLTNQWFMPETPGSLTGNAYFTCLYVYDPVNTAVTSYLATLSNGFSPCAQIQGQQSGNLCTTKWASPPVTTFYTTSSSSDLYSETNAEFYYFYQITGSANSPTNTFVATPACPAGQSGTCNLQGGGRGPGAIAWNNSSQSSSSDGSYTVAFSATSIPVGTYFIYIHTWRSNGDEEMCPSTGTGQNKNGEDYSKTITITASDYGKTCYLWCSGAATQSKDGAHYHIPNINMSCY